LNDYTNAIANFEHCLLLGDTSLFINKYLGFSYFFSSNDNKAYPYLIQAFEQDSTNNSVLYALASVNQTIENYPEAIRLYEKLIHRVIPEYSILYAYYKKLAESYNQNKDYQSAIDNYKKALIYCSDNQNINLLFNLADIYDIQMHEYDIALDFYKQYKKSLVSYFQFLSNQNDPNEKEIESVSDRIKNLDEHIIYLEDKVKIKN
jgi:tetratricopeptide (TPR) repeat protein